jgi:hypothetical protein
VSAHLGHDDQQSTPGADDDQKSIVIGDNDQKSYATLAGQIICGIGGSRLALASGRRGKIREEESPMESNKVCQKPFSVIV